MKLINRIKWISIFVSLMLLIVACSSIQKEEVKLPEKREEPIEEPIEPTKGGEMTLSIRTPKSLNPLLNEEHTVDQALKLIFDTLIDFDDMQKPVPNLASEWELSDEGAVLTVKLRSDVKWHDETSFTSKDVIFSLDTIKKAPDSSAYKKCIQNISSYKAIDEHTIKIIYNQPFSGAVYGLYFPIIPAHIYEGKSESRIGQIKPIGTGAYQLQEFVPTKELSLIVNNNWFKGEPYIERIKVVITPDEETDLYSFEQGQLDLIRTDVIDWEKYSEKESTRIHEYITSYYDFIGFNFNKPLFQDKNIRKAIAFGIDRQALLEKHYLNHGIITNSPINPKSWLYSHETEQYNFDKEKSKQILFEAGWSDSDQDGILDKLNNDNKIEISFELLISSENIQRKEVAYDIQSMLKELGINIQVKEVTQEEFLNHLKEKSFDAFLGGWKLSPIPDYSFAFHSSQIEDGTNYISFNSTEMDTLLQEAFSAVGEEDMKSIYKNLQKYISEELPYLSLYFRTAALITNERIQGEIKPRKEFFAGNIQDWFIYEKPLGNIEEENSDVSTIE